MPHSDHTTSPKHRGEFADSVETTQPAFPASSGTTLSGTRLKTVYTSEDLRDFDPQASLGSSGEFPYTRGIYPTMYRGKLWTMRQYAGFGSHADAEEYEKDWRGMRQTRRKQVARQRAAALARPRYS